jgi:hypothetical protein
MTDLPFQPPLPGLENPDEPTADQSSQDPSNTDIELLTASLADDDDVLTLISPEPGISADPALDYDDPLPDPDTDPASDLDPEPDRGTDAVLGAAADGPAT